MITARRDPRAAARARAARSSSSCAGPATSPSVEVCASRGSDGDGRCADAPARGRRRSASGPVDVSAALAVRCAVPGARADERPRPPAAVAAATEIGPSSHALGGLPPRARGGARPRRALRPPAARARRRSRRREHKLRGSRLAGQRARRRGVGDAEPAAERGAAHRGRRRPTSSTAAARACAGRARCCSTASRSTPASCSPCRPTAPRSRRCAGSPADDELARRAAAAASCEHGGSQCGFCTPGMVLTAHWYLDAAPGRRRARRSAPRSPATSAAARATAKILDAVEAYAQGRGNGRLTTPRTHGRRPHRVGGPSPRDFVEKVAGALRYADDWTPARDAARRASCARACPARGSPSIDARRRAPSPACARC